MWLRQNTPPDAKVLVTALEVGYYAKRYMFDSPGLTTPQILEGLYSGKNLNFFQQGDLVGADYLLVPETGPPPPNYQLLHIYRYEGKLSEFEPMAYGLYKRIPVKAAAAKP